MTGIVLPTLKCKRCGWRWFPRVPKLPKVCPNPKCKSPYWDKDYVRADKVKELDYISKDPKEYFTKKLDSLTKLNKHCWGQIHLDNKIGLPLLSVGQMIEFLGDGWWQLFNSHRGNKYLCDGLWGETKKKLEK